MKNPKMLIDALVGNAIRIKPTIKRDRDIHKSLPDLILLKFFAVSILMKFFVNHYIKQTIVKISSGKSFYNILVNIISIV